MVMRALCGSSGGGSKLFEEDFTPSTTADITITCGFEPRIILLYDNTNASSWPFVWGYIKDGVYGDVNKNVFYIDSTSSGVGILEISSSTYQSKITNRGGIKSVSSTGCVISQANTSYNKDRHIILMQ